MEVDLESSIAGMSNSEGTWSQSPSNLEPSTEQLGTRVSKLAIVVSHVTSKVGLLFQMSNVIRKLQPSHTSLKSLEDADVHQQLQSDLRRLGKGVEDSSIPGKDRSASSTSRAEAATTAHAPRLQRESASALPHNESYPKKISRAIEKRQHALLWADSSLIRTTEYLSMEDWPRNVMAEIDMSHAARRETPVLQAYNRQLLPLPVSDPTGRWTNPVGMFNEVPERLQINSLLLHQELEQITSIQFNFMPLRMGSPYKLLIQYLPDIELRLKALQRSQEMSLMRENKTNTNTEKGTPANPAPGRRWPKGEVGDEDVRTETIATTVAHLECLLQFINFDLAPLVELREEIKNQTLTHITFDNIWHLIKPGDLLLSNDGEKFQLVRAYSVTGGQRRTRNRSMEESLSRQVRGMKTATWNPFQQNEDSEDEYVESRIDATSGVGTWAPLRVDSFSMCANGFRVGPIEVPRKIKHFAGKKKITDLEIYPLVFHEHCEVLLEQMRHRGMKYIEAFGHKGYQGIGQLLSGENRLEEIDGDVFVDPESFYQAYPSQQPRLGRLRKSQPDASETTESFFNHYMASIQSVLMPVKIGDFDSADVENVALLPRLVIGFSFHAHSWFLLDIDDIISIEAQSNHAFDQLVLPPGHKKLILSQVKNHMSQRSLRYSQKQVVGSKGHAQTPQDIVRGKGLGLIFLLHGPPGTGKTSTAEAVAAYVGRPLYTITSRDIGADSESMDKRLREHTARAEKWGCIMVLDEADVLTTRRSLTDIRRNTIVNVFLRELEYYSGIMFMTTNRVGVIDEAIVSRIHFSIHYPPLSRKASREIWWALLSRIKNAHENPGPKIVFNKTKILAYIDRNQGQMNGRQIRNAAQTAVALAKEGAASADSPDWAHSYDSSGLADLSDASGSTDSFYSSGLADLSDASGSTDSFYSSDLTDFSDSSDSTDSPQEIPGIVRLRCRHFKVIFALSAQFDEYFKSVSGFDRSTHAERNQLRNDNFELARNEKVKKVRKVKKVKKVKKTAQAAP
ncbi:hypothetical protein PFICI_03830 [Pestalotiopsis fici W106-1]|uniref:AAA+ ATPase domain-containing protein n=1 Tax=Pestalotiopsis fici (strain W106-1 / CGMCC3.15140) TaxID=1229662 RepID=W3XIF9_PESFW|nr:uncharacterized protein PFICI_03830 [Pestalotiopsis fici W106-1]ETS85805.1 hypothetical protein PFICI_03830 [Pestalotiopsis fici W106-1]